MNQNIVTETSSNLRALARVALQGNWKLAVAATAVYLVALQVPATILDVIFGGEIGVSPLSGIYTLLVSGPFTIGYSIFCLSLFRKKEAEVAQIFYGFERFGKAIGLVLVMSIFIFLWTLLFIVPGIIAAFRYSQAFLIMIDHPEYGIMQCLAESKRIMTGNKSKLFCLELSFIGWAILAYIPMIAAEAVFGNVGLVAKSAALFAQVGELWLSPYMLLASVAFYELATGNLRPGVIEADSVVLDGEISYIKEEPKIDEVTTYVENENKEN